MSGETNYQIFSGDSLQREMLQSSEEQRLEQLKAEFANEYDISSKAGQSGQGDVFFARHKKTLQWYVLKAAKTEGKVFEQEARFALSLGKHPNLVYTHTIIEKNKKQFLLMEYIGPRPYSIKQKVRGDTLTNELKHFTRGLKKEQALLWAIDLCHGMEYLYSKKDFQGHNDIKPDNLFITQEGVLKVGDFGMVNQVRGGTRGYRSKEFREGKQGQARDIYAFGIVFYQMLNGLKNPEHPTIYGAKTLLNDTREDLLLDWAAINKSKYSAILRKCLKEDDKDRYTGFSALRADLEKEFEKLGCHLRARNYALTSLTAYEYVNKGNGWDTLHEYQKEIYYYDKAIELDPKYMYAYYNRGLAKYDLKRYEEAITDYDKVIELDPKYRDAYNNRGLAKYYLNRYEEAMADYDKGIELDPKYAWGYNARAVVETELKQYKNALNDCNKAIELDPEYKYAYNTRGLIKQHFKRYGEAIADYDNAIKLDPKYRDAYNNRGNSNRGLKQYAKSLKDLNEAILLDSQCPQIFYNRGLTYYFLKDYEKAIIDYTKALKLDPKYTWAYNRRGIVKCYLKRYEEAITDFDKAIKLDPKWSVAYRNRGGAKYLVKRYEEAITDYDKAIKLNPKYINAYLHRGKVYMHLKKYTQAEKDFQQALLLNKNDKEALEQLLKLYQTQNKLCQAAQIQKQLDDLNKNKGE